MSLTDYQWYVRNVTDQFLSRIPTTGSLARLTHSLGKPFSPDKDDVRNEHAESIVVDAWIAVLHSYELKSDLTQSIELHILAALLPKERWRDCLLSEQSSYDFVVVVTRFLHRYFTLDEYVPLGDSEVHKSVMQEIRRVLVGWLPAKDVLTELGFARALFGDAYCDVVLGVYPIATHIARDRPPFLGGRVSWTPTVTNVVLPALGLDCL